MRLLSFPLALDRYEMIIANSMLRPSSHSNFQGVIITPLSGANLTPYSGVIFWGVILTLKRSLKNSFSGVKVTLDIEELK